MKSKRTIAEALSKKDLDQILEERRRKKRLANARWRQRHPSTNREIYLRYFTKKREAGLVYKIGVGWVKKQEGEKPCH
jgi:hypothetical protein